MERDGESLALLMAELRERFEAARSRYATLSR